jgi:hypothetical protein
MKGKREFQAVNAILKRPDKMPTAADDVFLVIQIAPVWLRGSDRFR